MTKTNLEAAVEVVRQLRLRDIGGIVIIDFIDMGDAANRRAVKAVLDAELERDRTRTFVAEISPLGLVEMTRQNISDGPREVMTEGCEPCHGTGIVLSDETVAIDLERDLRAAVVARSEAKVTVALHPSALPFFSGDESERLTDLEAETGKRVRLEGDGSLAPGALKVRAAAA